MGRCALLRIGLLSLAIVCLIRPAAAQSVGDDWPKLLFKQTFHDFGTVARGAVVEYRFHIENPFVEDIEIDKVSSSCSCTKPSFTKKTLKTYEGADIVATLDTRNYGPKQATIKVEFTQPYRAIFELKTAANIRGDIVFEPGVIQFGTVAQGETVRKQVSIMYAGRSTWKILSAGTDSQYLGLQIAETGRSVNPSTGATLVNYDLWVTLQGSPPPGYIKDQVVIRTNDANPQNSRVPITVEGLVLSSLSVSPTVLMMEPVEPGKTVTKNLVVHGQRPFRILSVTGPDSQFHFTYPQVAKDCHIIAVQFQATDKPGSTSGKIRITTDIPGAAAVEASVGVTVLAPATSTDASK